MKNILTATSIILGAILFIATVLFMLNSAADYEAKKIYKPGLNLSVKESK